MLVDPDQFQQVLVNLFSNAADAMVVAQVALGLLRQKLRPTDRIHGIVTSGGAAENIVPELTTARFMIRANSAEQMSALREQVVRCFEAGALASGTALSIESKPAYREMRHDTELADAYQRNAELLGRTFEDDGRIEFRRFSSDIGNVSQLVPAIHPILGIATESVNHQPAFAAATVSPAADQAILDGALARAWTAIDAATEDSLRERLLAGGLSAQRRRQATRRAARGCAGGQCSARSRAGSRKAAAASQPDTKPGRPSSRSRAARPAPQGRSQ